MRSVNINIWSGKWLVGQMAKYAELICWSGKCKISMKVGEMVGRGIGMILLQIGELVIGQITVGQN